MNSNQEMLLKQLRTVCKVAIIYQVVEKLYNHYDQSFSKKKGKKFLSHTFILRPSGLMPTTGVYSSTFTVTGSEEINNKDVKCIYTVKDYGYKDSTQVVKSYLTGEYRKLYLIISILIKHLLKKRTKN